MAEDYSGGEASQHLEAAALRRISCGGLVPQALDSTMQHRSAQGTDFVSPTYGISLIALDSHQRPCATSTRISLCAAALTLPLRSSISYPIRESPPDTAKLRASLQRICGEQCRRADAFGSFQSF